MHSQNLNQTTNQDLQQFSAALLGKIEDKMDTWLRQWTAKMRDGFSETGESKDFNNQTM